MKKQNIIGIKILRENMEKYISAVEKGETFLVMRKSTPVFKMAPVDEWGDNGSWDNIADFKDMPLGGIPAKQFQELLKAIYNGRSNKIPKKTSIKRFA